MPPKRPDTLYSILAVTGLAGHALGSWTPTDGKEIWIRFWLPEDMPNTRVLTYGYDTALKGENSSSFMSIERLGRSLLETFIAYRERTEVSKRVDRAGLISHISRQPIDPSFY